VLNNEVCSKNLIDHNHEFLKFDLRNNMALVALVLTVFMCTENVCCILWKFVNFCVNCSKEINVCDNNPCQNKGTCINYGSGNYSCQCVSQILDTPAHGGTTFKYDLSVDWFDFWVCTETLLENNLPQTVIFWSLGGIWPCLFRHAPL